MGSDNVTGGDNQQETGEGIKARARILRDCTPSVVLCLGDDEDIVRPAWRHAEPGRNDLAHTGEILSGNNVPKVAKFLVG
jgi:hypothetical protein